MKRFMVCDICKSLLNLANALRLFREGVTWQPAAGGFCRGWREAKQRNSRACREWATPDICVHMLPIAK